MDIGSGKGFPQGNLSNFSPHPFTVTWRGNTLECSSMEGFLQGLKFSNPDMQVYVATLVGLKAKMKGKRKNWWKDQKLYWFGEALDRHGPEYQELLDTAYEALSKNTSFKKALLATMGANLTHSLGKTDPKQTVLTVSEFCGRLMNIRERLKKERREGRDAGLQ